LRVRRSRREVRAERVNGERGALTWSSEAVETRMNFREREVEVIREEVIIRVRLRRGGRGGRGRRRRRGVRGKGRGNRGRVLFLQRKGKSPGTEMRDSLAPPEAVVVEGNLFSVCEGRKRGDAGVLF
jgi:hypothetical protein